MYKKFIFIIKNEILLYFLLFFNEFEFFRVKKETSPQSSLMEQKAGEGKDMKFKLPSNADLKNLVQIGTSYKDAAANAEEKQEVGN